MRRYEIDRRAFRFSTFQPVSRASYSVLHTVVEFVLSKKVVAWEVNNPRVLSHVHESRVSRGSGPAINPTPSLLPSRRSSFSPSLVAIPSIQNSSTTEQFRRMSSGSRRASRAVDDLYPRARHIHGVLANGVSADLLLESGTATHWLRVFGGNGSATSYSALLAQYPRPSGAAASDKSKSGSSTDDNTSAGDTTSPSATASSPATPFLLDSSWQPVPTDELVRGLPRHLHEPNELHYRIRSEAMYLFAAEMATKCKDGRAHGLWGGGFSRVLMCACACVLLHVRSVTQSRRPTGTVSRCFKCLPLPCALMLSFVCLCCGQAVASAKSSVVSALLFTYIEGLANVSPSDPTAQRFVDAFHAVINGLPTPGTPPLTSSSARAGPIAPFSIELAASEHAYFHQLARISEKFCQYSMLIEEQTEADAESTSSSSSTSAPAPSADQKLSAKPHTASAVVTKTNDESSKKSAASSKSPSANQKEPEIAQRPAKSKTSPATKSPAAAASTAKSRANGGTSASRLLASQQRMIAEDLIRYWLGLGSLECTLDAVKFLLSRATTATSAPATAPAPGSTARKPAGSKAAPSDALRSHQLELASFLDAWQHAMLTSTKCVLRGEVLPSPIPLRWMWHSQVLILRVDVPLSFASEDFDSDFERCAQSQSLRLTATVYASSRPSAAGRAQVGLVRLGAV
jgi:hypothetical protein